MLKKCNAKLDKILEGKAMSDYAISRANLNEIEYRAKHKNGKYQWMNNKYMVVEFPNPE